MKELLETIARGLVVNKDGVTVTVDEPNEENVVVYHLHVAPEDMGRVIGKQGRIAKAVRVVMRAGATRVNQKVAVEIDWETGSVSFPFSSFWGKTGSRFYRRRKNQFPQRPSRRCGTQIIRFLDKKILIFLSRRDTPPDRILRPNKTTASFYRELV